MSFHAQLLRDLDLGNDVSSYNYQAYAASSRPSVHNLSESTSWLKATLHFSAPVLLILAGIIYTLLHAYDLTWLSLTDFSWNCIVHWTPYKLVVIFDKETQAATLGASKLNTSVSHAEKSAMMRRIIGLDKPGGLIHNVTQAGRRRLSSVVGLSGLGLRGGGSEDSTNPAGLGNWDNSCYQNSVLQGLSSLKGFDNYLLGPNAAEFQSDVESQTSSDSDKTILDESPGAEMQMANSLYNLIKKLNDPANNGGRLWTPAPLKNMSSWEQQDAQEYFSKILDAIDQEIIRSFDRRNPNAYDLPEVMNPGSLGYYGGRRWQGFKEGLRNPLEGCLAQRVACTFCRYTDGLMMIPFCTLTLAIPATPKKRVGVAYTIEDLLDEYTKLEFIDGVHCGRCTLLRKRAETLFLLYEHPKFPERARPAGIRNLAAVNEALEDEDYETKTLKTKCLIPDHHMVDSTKSKQAVIARPPKSLVIHINRSMFDEQTGELRKNHSPVKFEEELDLGPWTLGSASSPSTRQKGVEGPDEEDWTTNPVRSMISRGTPNDPSGRNQLKNALAVNRGWNGGRMQPDLPPKKSLVKGPIYKLKAMIVHQGRHENGHYITYKRFPVHVGSSPTSSASSSPASAGSDEIEMQHFEDRPPSVTSNSSQEAHFEERWFRLSDDDVCQVSSDDVFSYYSQQGAFMLFYDQISPAERLDAVPNPPTVMKPNPIPATVPDDQCSEAHLSADDLKIRKLLERWDEHAKVDETSKKAWLEQLDILSPDSGSIGSPATAIWDPRSPASAAGSGGSGASGQSLVSDASVVTAIWNPLPEHIEARRREADERDDEEMWARIEGVARNALPSRVEIKLAEILERTDAALTPPGPSSIGPKEVEKVAEEVQDVAQGTADEVPAPAMPLRKGNAQASAVDAAKVSPLVEASDSEMTSTAASSPQMKPLDPVVPIVVKPYAGNSQMAERGGGRRRRKGKKGNGAGMLMV